MRIKSLSPQFTKRLWQALLLLSPLAYLAGFALYRHYNAEWQFPFDLDRGQAIQVARDFASSQKVITQTWDAFCKTDVFGSRYQYFRFKENAATAEAQQFAPVIVLLVLLVDPEHKQSMEVTMMLNGRVLGFKRKFATGEGVTEIEEPAARQLALSALQARAEFSLMPTGLRPLLAEDRDSGTAIRQYTWNWKAAATPELENKTTISIRGNEVIVADLTSNVETQFAERNITSGTLPGVIAAASYVLLAIIVTTFGIFRFTERLRQKEVPYVRILILAVIVMAGIGGYVFQTDVVVFEASGDLRMGDLAMLNKVFSFLFWAFGGLVLGFAYGSGEGDLRELYPGKLTSLDALLSGRFFSGNVAQAVIHGTALSGWLFLLIYLVVAPFAQRPGAGWRIASLEPQLAHYPWLALLMSWPSMAILAVIFTLLLPLPLLQRRLSNQRVIGVTLFIIACITSVIIYVQSLRPWPLALLATLIAAGAMLWSFFRFDVLTAIFTLSIARLVSTSVLFAAQPAPNLRFSGYIVIGIEVLVLVVALVFYFKGRIYLEDEVRPLYASHLAERLSLQAEVSAAREAQIRLLPDKLPEIRQLNVAAVCQPAHEVGGDFYDLFELEGGKLGIFMAEGGGRGLPAALTIAFAKGFLMPKIKSETISDNSPTEIVRSLQSQLMKTMAEDEVMGFTYAVIDPGDQTLRYAGTGTFPRPNVNPHATLARLTEEESELTFILDEERKFTVTEGIFHLNEGDTVALLSDGALRMVSEDRTPQTFWEKLTQHSDTSYHLRDALNDAFREGHRRRPELKDDLTAVIVRLKETGGAG